MTMGVVRWFDTKKGYGFIDGDGHPDVFVHYSSFSQNGPKSLNQGDKVIYEIVKGQKGPKADSVEIAQELPVTD